MQNTWSVNERARNASPIARNLNRDYLEAVMRKVAIGFLVAGLSLSAFAWSAFAHHAFAGEYDKDNPLRLTGIVTKIEWMNPHARFYIDVKDESGNVTNWNIELGPPLILRRAGWRVDSLKVGDQVTVQGYRAKDGSKMANGSKVTLADGRQVFSGSTAEGIPTQ
jgi:hypothetical protein